MIDLLNQISLRKSSQRGKKLRLKKERTGCLRRPTRWTNRLKPKSKSKRSYSSGREAKRDLIRSSSKMDLLISQKPKISRI